MGCYKNVYLVGNGRIADDCLKILVQNHILVSYIEVVAQPFSRTKRLCESLNIEFLHMNPPEMKAFLTAINQATLIISVHNSYIFTSEAINNPNLTIINLHIALLPNYRGVNAPTWEIYNQEKYAGATWHEIDESIDTGKIIIQESFPIGEDDTAIKVLQASFYKGVELLEKNLDSFLEKRYSTHQINNKNSRLYLAKNLPNDGYMDEAWDYDKTYAFLRSMDYSGTNIMRLPRVNFEGKEYEIISYKKTMIGKHQDKRKTIIKDDQMSIMWGECGLKCGIREIKETS